VSGTINKTSNTINQEVYGITNKKDSINYSKSVIIKSSDINATIDNSPSNTQIYTFGSSITNRWVAVGQGTNTIAFSNDGFVWNALGSSIFSNGNGVAYNGSMWVAVGEGITHTIAYSYDGINWIGLGNSIFSVKGNGVAYGGNMWIAVGQGTTGEGINSIAYSYNGINWIGLGVSIFNVGNGIAYGGNMWIAVGEGNNNNNIYSSNDGINWLPTLEQSFSTRGYGIAYNGNTWVAVGSGGATITYSYNGKNWLPTSGQTFSNFGYGIAYNGNMWVAVGQGASSSIAYSYDSVNWIETPTNIFSVYGKGISWNGKIWVAVGSGTTKIAYSYDGINWLGLDDSGQIFSSGNGIAFNNLRTNTITFNQNIIVAGGLGNTNNIAYSYDGINEWFSANYADFHCCNSVAFNGNMWIAGGTKAFNNNFTIAYSYNGINWNSIYGSADIIQDVYGICFFNNMWIAVGLSSTANNNIIYSYDGFTWLSTTNSLMNCYGVASNGNMLVAVGEGYNPNLYTFSYSYNGINWNVIENTPFSDGSGNGIVWNGLLWVAVGNGVNSIAYSNDGINWYGLGNSIFSFGFNIAWNGSLFVAVGFGNNTIAYSYDGINWSGVNNSPFSTIGNDVSWCGNVWIAIGGGLIAYSYDGITWHGNQSPNFYTGYCVSWSGNQNGSVYIQQPFLASGKKNPNTYKLIYSTDGNLWREIAKPLFSDNPCNGIMWNGDYWLAISKNSNNNNFIAKSIDGINWSVIQEFVVNDNFVDIKWCGNVWVVLAPSKLYYSYDSITWTENENPMTNRTAIAWSGTYWMFSGGVIGDNNLFYTNDITSNNFTEIDVTINTNDIVYGANKFVAIGGNSIIYISINDLNNFMPATSLFTNGNGINWNGKMFIAVGQGSFSIAYSYNGIDWVGVIGSNDIFETGNKVEWTGKKWIATGTPTLDATSQYVMAQSYDGIKWYGITDLVNNDKVVFNEGNVISSNSGIGACVVDSQMILSNTKTLDIVSGSYYDKSYNNFTVNITSTNL
jgi:hypothetical protein